MNNSCKTGVDKLPIKYWMKRQSLDNIVCFSVFRYFSWSLKNPWKDAMREKPVRSKYCFLLYIKLLKALILKLDAANVIAMNDPEKMKMLKVKNCRL